MYIYITLTRKGKKKTLTNIFQKFNMHAIKIILTKAIK